MSTPLVPSVPAASYNGHVECLEYLIGRHADVNGVYGGKKRTALHYAAAGVQTTMVKSQMSFLLLAVVLTLPSLSFRILAPPWPYICSSKYASFSPP